MQKYVQSFDVSFSFDGCKNGSAQPVPFALQTEKNALSQKTLLKRSEWIKSKTNLMRFKFDSRLMHRSAIRKKFYSEIYSAFAYLTHRSFLWRLIVNGVVLRSWFMFYCAWELLRRSVTKLVLCQATRICDKNKTIAENMRRHRTLQFSLICRT